MNVLVIDDEERTIDLLRRALRLLGHRVIGASSDAELRSLVSTQPASRVDAVLLDESMPGCDCAELLRTLKAWSAKMPVLLLTNCGAPTADERVLAGSDGMVEKPFDLDELDQALRVALVRSLEKGASASGELPGESRDVLQSDAETVRPGAADAPTAEKGINVSEPVQRARRKRVLLVDDTQTVVMFEKLMLGSQGYEIMVAHDGNEALLMTKDWAPDLVLLDIMMPNLDGIQTCRALKSDPATHEIPVIMVTTRGEPEKVEEAFQAGCDDYLTKPLDRLELLVKIKSFLK